MLELVVKLPASMPLRAPELECRKRVGGQLLWRGRVPSVCPVRVRPRCALARTPPVHLNSLPWFNHSALCSLRLPIRTHVLPPPPPLHVACSLAPIFTHTTGNVQLATFSQPCPTLPGRPAPPPPPRQVGVSEGRLRKWLLSIAAFLRTQNGSVAEAIALWKRNVDKEFEGGWVGGREGGWPGTWVQVGGSGPAFPGSHWG